MNTACPSSICRYKSLSLPRSQFAVVRVQRACFHSDCLRLRLRFTQPYEVGFVDLLLVAVAHKRKRLRATAGRGLSVLPHAYLSVCVAAVLPCSSMLLSFVPHLGSPLGLVAPFAVSRLAVPSVLRDSCSAACRLPTGLPETIGADDAETRLGTRSLSRVRLPSCPRLLPVVLCCALSSSCAPLAPIARSAPLLVLLCLRPAPSAACCATHV